MKMLIPQFPHPVNLAIWTFGLGLAVGVWLATACEDKPSKPKPEKVRSENDH